MKGIIFNLLEEAVRNDFGEDAWDALIEASGSSGVYTSLGTYPDQELLAFVSAASKLLGKSIDDIVKWFGVSAVPLLHARLPELFRRYQSTRSFLLGLNDIIHPEVRKVFPGADVPDFAYDTADPKALLMEYRSKRQLCALAEGLTIGVAKHFGNHVEFQHLTCMKQGAEYCKFRITCP